MRFTKMHGLGNDYVYVDATREMVGDAPALARAVSDRHLGIGGDGLILIDRSTRAAVRMEMYNADGSRAQMCGNGIRCVAKFAYERGLVRQPDFEVETDGGLRRCECTVEEGRVQRVRVDMGKPSFRTADLPCTLKRESLVDHPFHIGEMELTMTCVSMGNPHAVVFRDDIHRIDLAQVGPQIEHAAVFPARINAHFVRVDHRRAVTVRTWERGSGATRACGTGACAVCVAAARTGRTERSIRTSLPGGDLDITWGDDDHVYMTGPAVEVFTGEWPL